MNIFHYFGQAGGTYAFFICNNSFFHKKDFSNKRKLYDKIFDVINDPIYLIGLFSHFISIFP